MIDVTIMESAKKIKLVSVFLVGMENSALFLAVQTIVLQGMIFIYWVRTRLIKMNYYY